MHENTRRLSLAGLPLFLQALAGIILFSLSASADDPLHRLFGCYGVPDCVGKWCPDDYCPKKEPCVCVPLCLGCDDYCNKKAPCICAPIRFQCDDYCKKCPPRVCSRPQCQYLSCKAAQQPCGCGTCAKKTLEFNHDRVAMLDKTLNSKTEDELADKPLGQAAFAPVIMKPSDFKLSE